MSVTIATTARGTTRRVIRRRGRHARPGRNVARFIAGLRRVAERRYATKEWKRLAGLRKTRATPFHLTSARARTIRARVGELTTRPARTRAHHNGTR